MKDLSLQIYTLSGGKTLSFFIRTPEVNDFTKDNTVVSVEACPNINTLFLRMHLLIVLQYKITHHKCPVPLAKRYINSVST
jgi:hypothetical protein